MTLVQDSLKKNNSLKKGYSNGLYYVRVGKRIVGLTEDEQASKKAFEDCLIPCCVQKDAEACIKAMTSNGLRVYFQ